MTSLVSIYYTTLAGAIVFVGTLLCFGLAVRFRHVAIAPRCTARPKDTIYNPNTKGRECQNRGSPTLGWITWSLGLKFDTMLNGVPGTGTRNGGLNGAMLKVNLDSIILIRFHDLCLKVCILTTLLCFTVILPINWSAECVDGEKACVDMTDYENTTLASIPEIKVGGNWLHFEDLNNQVRLYAIVLCAWIVCYYTIYLVSREWKEALCLRRAYYLEADHHMNRKRELESIVADTDFEDDFDSDILDDNNEKPHSMSTQNFTTEEDQIRISQRDPWIPHPEQRDTVPNIELYSVLVENIPSLPSEILESGAHDDVAGYSERESMDWQLTVATAFFDHIVPNAPGFSSSVAAITILPTAPELATAWRKWYKAAAALRRLRFIRKLIGIRRRYDIETEESAAENSTNEARKSINQQRLNNASRAPTNTHPQSLVNEQAFSVSNANYMGDVFGSKDDPEVESKFFEMLKFGPEQTALYSREFAQGAAACCPNGCGEGRVMICEFNELLDMEEEAVQNVQKANRNLENARLKASKNETNEEKQEHRNWTTIETNSTTADYHLREHNNENTDHIHRYPPPSMPREGNMSDSNGRSNLFRIRSSVDNLAAMLPKKLKVEGQILSKFSRSPNVNLSNPSSSLQSGSDRTNRIPRQYDIELTNRNSSNENNKASGITQKYSSTEGPIPVPEPSSPLFGSHCLNLLPCDPPELIQCDLDNANHPPSPPGERINLNMKPNGNTNAPPVSLGMHTSQYNGIETAYSIRPRKKSSDSVTFGVMPNSNESAPFSVKRSMPILSTHQNSSSSHQSMNYSRHPMASSPSSTSSKVPFSESFDSNETHHTRHSSSLIAKSSGKMLYPVPPAPSPRQRIDSTDSFYSKSSIKTVHWNSETLQLTPGGKFSVRKLSAEDKDDIELGTTTERRGSPSFKRAFSAFDDNSVTSYRELFPITSRSLRSMNPRQSSFSNGSKGFSDQLRYYERIRDSDSIASSKFELQKDDEDNGKQKGKLLKGNFMSGLRNFRPSRDYVRKVSSRINNYFNPKVVVSNLARENTIAVVTFTSRQGAAAARHCLMDSRGQQLWLADNNLPVPPLADAASCDLKTCRGCCRPVTVSINQKQEKARKYCARASLVLLYIFYIYPINEITNLMSDNEVLFYIPFLQKLKKHEMFEKLLSGLVQGLLLTLFFAVAPQIFRLIANTGSNANSVISAELSAMKYYWWFMVLTAFSGSNLLTAALEIIDTFKTNDRVDYDGKVRNILNTIANDVPDTVSVTWMNWIILRTTMVLPLQYLLQVNTFLFYWMGWDCCARCVMGGGPGGQTPYRIYIDSGVVFMCNVSLSYASPLVALCALVYFLLCGPLWRRNSIFLYRPKFDGGGIRWPFLADEIFSGLMVGQILLWAMMSLKKAHGPAIMAVLPTVPTFMARNFFRSRYYKAYSDVGLLQTSLLDGWDNSIPSSVEKREDFRRFLVDAHKAAYVPVCIAGDVHNNSTGALTAEPAAVVEKLDDINPPDHIAGNFSSFVQTPQQGVTLRRVAPIDSFQP